MPTDKPTDNPLQTDPAGTSESAKNSSNNPEKVDYSKTRIVSIELTNPLIKIANKPKKVGNVRHIPTRVATLLDAMEGKCPICGTNNKSFHYCNRIINGLKERGIPEEWIIKTARWELQRRLNDVEKFKSDLQTLDSFNEVQLEAYLTAQKIKSSAKDK